MAASPSWLDRAQWPYAPRTCAVAGGRMHYVDEGHGPTVVLVHGTPSWGFEWRHVIGNLRGSHRVVVPDHLGFGLSDRPLEADYRPEAHAARFAAFMRRVVPEGLVSLVVHDFGGPIALAWALDNPHRLASAAAVNSWMWSFEDDRAMWRQAGAVDNPLGRWAYRRLNASLRLLMPMAYGDRRRLTPAIHRQYLGPFADVDGRERVLFALARALRGSSAFYADLWARRDALADVPMALLWGSRDRAFGSSVLDKWLTSYPGAEVTCFDTAGHWPHEEAPAPFCDALRRHLLRARRGQADPR